MKLWRISQEVNSDYDTFDSAVVAAETEDAARMTHPNGIEWDGKRERYSSWCNAKDVKVDLIGEAAPGTNAGVIVASFNAG